LRTVKYKDFALSNLFAFNVVEHLLHPVVHSRSMAGV